LLVTRVDRRYPPQLIRAERQLFTMVAACGYLRVIGAFYRIQKSLNFLATLAPLSIYSATKLKQRIY
jgi:hypothetical protein